MITGLIVLGGMCGVLGIGGLIADYVMPHISFINDFIEKLPAMQDLENKRHEHDEVCIATEIVRLNECVYDISVAAQWLIDRGHIDVEDSRELFATVLSLAYQFDKAHRDEGDDEYDYMSAIEEFAFDKLCKQYGKEVCK